MQLPEDRLLLDFLQYLRFEKRYSDHTVRAYNDDLLQFSVYLSREYELNKFELASTAMVRSWLSAQREGSAGVSPRTISRKLSSLRSFYKYLLKKGVIRVSPVNNLAAPKAGKKLPVYVEERQAAMLFDGSSFGDGWKGLTTSLILRLFYQTGMRLTELVTLKKSQVSTYTRSIKVLGKGNKERVVPVQEDLLEEIRKYEAMKATQWETYDTNHVLLTEKGKPLYAQYVYRIVKGYLGNFTTLSKRSPHILRHSFATHLLNNGAELNAVKELLGHASLAATQVYTHTTIGKLKEVHKKAHPKG
ncbi:tyrosine-type recombinase/integrase [Flavihumibacter profundi]|jgi:integrase/recombinase XerC|uniref:tyrosine-type recombinase/integrase n=1 Tax=Flavihumibacter profundi TaxID=2716883 RepID=UPI001CC34809|nr:tyrosine-type recombinase/integrase [Flavihumibacter profundi]MBZ5859146.1 tyrosine-type recombinase/integrase [Flavihumibacter profundi]